jgi:hypothetical protein
MGGKSRERLSALCAHGGWLSIVVRPPETHLPLSFIVLTLCISQIARPSCEKAELWTTERSCPIRGSSLRTASAPIPYPLHLHHASRSGV